MVGYMYKQVVEKTRKLIQGALYVAVTVDEVIVVANNSYLSVHAYVVQDWIRISLLVSL